MYKIRDYWISLKNITYITTDNGPFGTYISFIGGVTISVYYESQKHQDVELSKLISAIEDTK